MRLRRVGRWSRTDVVIAAHFITAKVRSPRCRKHLVRSPVHLSGTTTIDAANRRPPFSLYAGLKGSVVGAVGSDHRRLTGSP